jgi:hypothetical protein
MTETLRCSCCGLPWARIEDDVLIVTSQHHGEKHANVLSLDRFQKLCHAGEDGEESTPDGRNDARRVMLDTGR